MTKVGPARVVGLLIAIAAIASCAPSESSANPADMMVSIDPGLTPRMAPGAVALIALRQIEDMQVAVGVALRPARIVSVGAMREPAAWAAIGQGGNGLADRVVWLVRGEGTFYTNRGRGPRIVPPVPTGFFIIDDADGNISGFGFP